MAFNSYIILDGLRYKTLAKQWKPAITRPASARLTLQGNMEVTFGVGVLNRWEGSIIARPTTADPAYGTIDSLRASLRKTAPLAFTDHYGKEHSVVALGPFQETSLINVWEAAGNKIFVNVTLLSAGSPA